MINIANNLFRIIERLRVYEQKYGRKPGSVSLLAVSKHQAFEKMLDAFNAGQLAFGENYLQEALMKIAAFAEYDSANTIEWHFIGPIQRNKTRKIAEHFSWVHSVDDITIAKRLNEQRPLHLPPLSICLQVNLSHEMSKSGIEASDIFSLAKYCASLPQLRLRGLMTVPAPELEFAKQRQAFHQLFLLWQALRDQGIDLDSLSMGMSDDVEAAVAEGATMVRIGRAIFGSRG